MAILPEAITRPQAPRMKVVQNARRAPANFQTQEPMRMSVRVMKKADGNRAAKSLTPKTFMEAAWHQ